MSKENLEEKLGKDILQKLNDDELSKATGGARVVVDNIEYTCADEYVSDDKLWVALFPKVGIGGCSGFVPRQPGAGKCSNCRNYSYRNI